MKRTLIFFSLISAIGLFWLVSCESQGRRTARDEEVLSIRGFIQEVKVASLVQLESLKVKDENGKVWELTVTGPVGFTPSHVREHMVLGIPVTVKYKIDNGKLVVVSITD